MNHLEIFQEMTSLRAKTKMQAFLFKLPILHLVVLERINAFDSGDKMYPRHSSFGAVLGLSLDCYHN